MKGEEQVILRFLAEEEDEERPGDEDEREDEKGTEEVPREEGEAEETTPFPSSTVLF
jgi:hypothetical protein